MLGLRRDDEAPDVAGCVHEGCVRHGLRLPDVSQLLRGEQGADAAPCGQRRSRKGWGMSEHQTATRYEAGRELDALIAERVMGEVDARCPCGDGLSRTMTRSGATMAEAEAMLRADYAARVAGGMKMWPAEYCGPAYSEEIGAAWLVVEKLREQGFGFTIDVDEGDNSACFADSSGVYEAEISATTAPLAICRAALAALQSRSTSLSVPDSKGE